MSTWTSLKTAAVAILLLSPATAVMLAAQPDFNFQSRIEQNSFLPAIPPPIIKVKPLPRGTRGNVPISGVHTTKHRKR